MCRLEYYGIHRKWVLFNREDEVKMCNKFLFAKFFFNLNKPFSRVHCTEKWHVNQTSFLYISYFLILTLGICIPANCTVFIQSISEQLAQREPNLTLEVLKEYEVFAAKLTHFWPIFPFYIPWKHQKNFWFYGVFREYKMRRFARNGLKKERNEKVMKYGKC